MSIQLQQMQRALSGEQAKTEELQKSVNLGGDAGGIIVAICKQYTHSHAQFFSRACGPSVSSFFLSVHCSDSLCAFFLKDS